MPEPFAELAQHDHRGPDWRCEACKPLAQVLRNRMRWPSLHWGRLHDDAYPSLARAVHEAGYDLVQAALTIHQPRTIGFLTGACAAEDCEHEDECPETPTQVCAGCWELAETVTPYFTDHPVADGLLWPCATATALGVRVSPGVA